MKKLSLSFFLAFNFILSLSAMEQTTSESFEKFFDTLSTKQFTQLEEQMLARAKKDSKTVLDILQHELLIIASKVEQLRDNVSSKDKTIRRWKELEKYSKQIVKNLQEALNDSDGLLVSLRVYSLFPALYYSYGYFTDAREETGDVSPEVLDQLHKNLGKLSLINIHNENNKKASKDS